MGVLNFITTAGSFLVGGFGGAAAGGVWAFRHSKAINMNVGVVEVFGYAVAGGIAGATTLGLAAAALL